MKKLWFFAAGLLVAQPATADWWHALTAYEQQNYNLAQQEFEKLLPLGNKDAAFNLGAMYFNGEGVTQDRNKALAYFMLAAELGRTDAGNLVTQQQQNIDVQSLAAVEQQLQLLKQQVQVWPKSWENEPAVVERPNPIKRVPPKYPVAAAKAGQFGYVAMRFLVDERGKVQSADVVDAYPEGVFDRESVRAISRWQYEATGSKHLFNVRLDFAMDGGVRVEKVEELIDQHQLWQGALMGSPQHQFLLGGVLRLVDVQSRNYLSIDDSLDIEPQLDLSVFRRTNPVKVDFDGFVGYAVVRIADDGTITEELRADFAAESKVKSLLGLKLTGKFDHDVYQIVKNDVGHNKAPWVSASFKVPASYSANFWWDQAAQNGHRGAQRIMAAYDKRWEQYLLAQQDAEVMAWVGSRLILEGQRQQGLALLDAAIAKSYPLAEELKKQLM